MKLNPYPGYETHVLMNIGGPEYHYTMEEIQATIAEGKPAPGTTITDTQIPGPDDGQQLKLHVIKPANLPEKAPIVMDIHGGGFISGRVEIDDSRNLLVAENMPCIADLRGLPPVCERHPLPETAAGLRDGMAVDP